MSSRDELDNCQSHPGHVVSAEARKDPAGFYRTSDRPTPVHVVADYIMSAKNRRRHNQISMVLMTKLSVQN